MNKNFVLDTNVLLHDPGALLRFADNTVIIPIYVIEEIDQFKKELSELGRNARQVSRQLDAYRERGNLGMGVPLEGGGVLRVAFATKSAPPAVLNKQLADNLIMGVALELQRLEPDNQVIFVTKDTNLRVRADAMGLQAVNYEESSVNIDELYPGAAEVSVPAEVLAAFYENGKTEVEHHRGRPFVAGDEWDTAAREQDVTAGVPTFYPNEYVLLRNEANPSQTALTRVHPSSGSLVQLANVKSSVWGIRPRNKEQHYALDALLNDDIKLVTLIGKAGTGKTLMAIAAGLMRTADDEVYQRLLVSRPIFPLGRDVGFLPGTIEDKMNPWMQPIFDNIEYLLGLTLKEKRSGRSVEELIHLGLLQIEPLTFIRGRSIPQQYMIVDEAQNLTPHEVKTILTRVGDGTKIVLTGDPYQIDNPYVDSESNGLTYTINRFKGQDIAATVTLFKGERSEMAELAANLL